MIFNYCTLVLGAEGCAACKVNSERIQTHSMFQVGMLTADMGAEKVSDVIGSADVVCMQAALCLRLVRSGMLGKCQRW